MIPLAIGELNEAADAGVIDGLAPLFEGAPRFLGRLAAARPFGDWASLFATGRAIAHAMPEVEQIELIDAHPRLGAAPASVSSFSFREQGYDLEAVTGDEVQLAAALTRLNEAYEARLGFRYCVFVAGRPRAALLPEMAAALSADRDAELHRALDAVVDIAMARLDALRAPDG